MRYALAAVPCFRAHLMQMVDRIMPVRGSVWPSGAESVGAVSAWPSKVTLSKRMEILNPAFSLPEVIYHLSEKYILPYPSLGKPTTSSCS